jgi:hypothetical protein
MPTWRCNCWSSCVGSRRYSGVSSIQATEPSIDSQEPAWPLLYPYTDHMICVSTAGPLPGPNKVAVATLYIATCLLPSIEPTVRKFLFFAGDYPARKGFATILKEKALNQHKVFLSIQTTRKYHKTGMMKNMVDCHLSVRLCSPSSWPGGTGAHAFFPDQACMIRSSMPIG